MQKFRFHIDEKVTIWNRHYYLVEAENKEHAVEQMLVEFVNLNFDHGVTSEFLFETQESLSPADNGKQPTRELYFDKETAPFKTILHYQPKSKKHENTIQKCQTFQIEILVSLLRISFNRCINPEYRLVA